MKIYWGDLLVFAPWRFGSWTYADIPESERMKQGLDHGRKG